MSPRNEEQNEQIKDERREQILSAALRTFATRGFAATKIGDIAARAQVSHGLVYHYFKSKEEIFFVLLQRALDTSMQSVVRMEELPMPALEKVRTIARYILEGIESYADSAYYFLIVINAAVMESTQEIVKLTAQTDVTMASMERMLRAGQQAGDIAEGDTLGMAMAFFAAMEGLALYKLMMPEFRMPDPELLVNMVKRYPA